MQHADFQYVPQTAVEKMSCSVESYVSLSGSNGYADPLGPQGRFACKELTNWDGSKKLGLAAPEKKKGGGMSR